MAGIISEVARISARRGAEVLLEILENEGVQYIFGNPGTTELPLMDALLAAPELQYILALQEASAVAMADGYAQAARHPAFINLHTSGGLGHGMGNLLNTSVSQTPLVVTARQQDSRHTVTDPLLFGDLVQIASPAVKWAHEITSVDELPILVRRAFHDSSDGRTRSPRRARSRHRADNRSRYRERQRQPGRGDDQRFMIVTLVTRRTAYAIVVQSASCTIFTSNDSWAWGLSRAAFNACLSKTKIRHSKEKHHENHIK